MAAVFPGSRCPGGKASARLPHAGARIVAISGSGGGGGGRAALPVAALPAGAASADRASAADRAVLGAPAGSAGIDGFLIGVAASSARNAWAVGHTGSVCHPRPLVLHWSGSGGGGGPG